MEIFLLLVVLIFIIIFHFNYSSKFQRLHKHLDHLQKQVQDSIRAAQLVAPVNTEQKEEVKEKIIIEEKKETPPVVEKEEEKRLCY